MNREKPEPFMIYSKSFGDKDLDMRLSNPLHLRSVLEDARYSKSRIVLLHASYPFSKEASYLASVYPQVYLDFGLAIPKLSVHGMISSVKELLELAPINKVMFSTEAMHWLCISRNLLLRPDVYSTVPDLEQHST